MVAELEKKQRSTAKSNFTRNVKKLIGYLDNDVSQAEIVTPQFALMNECFELLEKAHQEFLNATDIDIDESQEGVAYMDSCDATHASAVARYSKFLSKVSDVQLALQKTAQDEQEKKEKETQRETEKEMKEAEQLKLTMERKLEFDTQKVQLESAITAFNCMVIALKDNLIDVSVTDRRRELEKVEKEYSSMKSRLTNLPGIDPTQDVAALNTAFVNDATQPFLDCQKAVLLTLKDEKATSGGSVSSSNLSLSTVRKEPVTLPSFEGDESKSPFLKFPTWKKQWEVMIKDYPSSYRDVMLWRHLDEAAQLKIIGYETMYDEAFERLCQFYGDPFKIIQCVMEEVTSPSEIAEGDYQALVNYSVVLEDNFNRLTAMGTEYQKEMSNASAMASILRKFPRVTGEQWYDYLGQQKSERKLNVFPVLIEWLKSRRATWEGMASVNVHRREDVFFVQSASNRYCYLCGSEDHILRDCPEKNNGQHNRNQQVGGPPGGSVKKKQRPNPSTKKYWCALHKDDATRRCYSDSCKELRLLDAPQRVQLLQNNGDCPHCCGDHQASACARKERICGGNKDDRGCKKSHHGHELFCLEARVFAVQQVHSLTTAKDGVLLLIMQVKMSRKVNGSVFWDTGCTSNFIREEFAKRCGFKGTLENLSVITLGGKVSDHMSVMTYKCSMLTVDGDTKFFEAYGMETITGAVSGTEHAQIQRLFPHLSDQNIRMLQRQPEVDILIGASHLSWHPEKVEKARDGGDLWMFRGMFGSCLGGRHPQIQESTRKSDNLFVSVHKNFHVSTLPTQSTSHEFEFCPSRCIQYLQQTPTANDDSVMTPSTGIPTETVPPAEIVSSGVGEDELMSGACFSIRTSYLTDEDSFFRSESIGTVVQPACGGCRCGDCPISGMKYSFIEQQEYDVIQRNLVYKEDEKRWFTEYPWKTDRSALPRNEKEALRLLLNVERSLQKDPSRCQGYCDQITSMIERGAAVELSPEQLESWDGDYHYLPILGVLKKDAWRLVFDAARRQSGHPSMNECIMKGPHRFMNDLGSVLLGFRNGRVAALADLRKFHNQVYLFDKDIHMQRFLWRNMKTDEPPKHMAVTVNNFGVTAANCIATSALHKSADHFSEIYPYESQYIKDQTYIDDELVAANDSEEIHTLTERLDEICDHAGMHNKGWVFSGEQNSSDVAIGDEEGEKVLGMSYSPSSDSFHFRVTLKLKSTTHGDISVTSSEDLRSHLPNLVLTRRVLLSNIARIFDPIGFLTTVLLQAKILMRESWCGQKVGWDDPLPADQHQRWIDFLFSLLSLGDIYFSRSLWPQEEVVGLPTLVIFSDGSVQAFGAAAYIHWKLKSGGHWSRLIMAKSKIGPKNIISVPRMELNGAVIGNRIKNFILKKTNLKFSTTIQLVDSSTVLGYVQKECGVFQPYEGVRVAEIQSSSTFVDGRIVQFAWVAGHDNPADWCTKPRSSADLLSPFWNDGPDFLKHDVSSWPLKFTYKKDNFEGQLHLPKQVNCLFVQAHHSDFLGRLVHRSSSWMKSIRVLAWILRFTDSWRFRLLHGTPLTSSELRRAKILLIKFAQRELVPELKQAATSGKGKFRKLAPIEDKGGVWRVGSRMRVVPFTLDAKLPALLPTNHRVTLLVMHHAHEHSHLAQDGTTGRFRAIGFWTVRCGHLAKSVYEKCVTCRKLNHRTLQQQMGQIPEECLTEPLAWGFCQLDLFGPFNSRSDVISRASKKTWGMIVEDVNSGAVHLDIVQDYSAQAVILSLRRFGALRGWPAVISSDPGSQLESAGGKLEEWWNSIGDSLLQFASSKNFEWKISPANSPWRQGKAERKIAIVKRLLSTSIGESRLTPVELQTVLLETANICNERPVGSAVPRVDGSYLLVTPNQLLLGRSSNVLPDDTAMVERLSTSARYRMVHHATTQFWKRWSEEVSPSLVIRQKWHEKTRNVAVGDLVMICDKGTLKAKYKIGIIDAVTVSSDNSVRSATIRYTIRNNDRVRIVRVTRSVQRLVLLLPIEEQTNAIVVEDDEVSSRVVKAGV